MSSVISLFNYNQKKDSDLHTLQNFIVLKKSEATDLFVISPDVVQISETLFVISLESTRPYWQTQSKKLNLTRTETYKDQLLSLCPPPSLCVLCSHPFQGLVFLLLLREKGMTGFYNLNQSFTQKNYQNISWDLWFKAAHIIHSYYKKNSFLTKTDTSFNKVLKRLKQLNQRLGIHKVYELKKAQVQDLQKRFGVFLGQLWGWTFPCQKQTPRSPSLFSSNHLYHQLQGFHWVNLQTQTKISINRSLEYPLLHWENIKSHLIEDFEKICTTKRTKPLPKVLKLNWHLDHMNMSQSKLNIEFKHPFSLLEDRQENFKTLVRQFFYAFSKLKESYNLKNIDPHNLYQHFIVNWSIQIDKVSFSTERTPCLFKNKEHNFISQEKLKSLQNKINPKISHQQKIENFLPGLDYQLSSPQQKLPLEAESSPFVLTPLFIYPSPQAWTPSSIKSKFFLQRSSAPWWLNSCPEDHFRDYFMCQSKDQQLIWAFRNHKGEWFKHGIFS